MKIREKLKQFFCSHAAISTETTFEDGAIVSRTNCMDCNKAVPRSSSRTYEESVRLLEYAQMLKVDNKQ